ncbi:uncharacterized protein LOC108740929 [Agrilus planipennis]|uniref:Uncharacterized protein LOC108740929 n=1 Tax=Agrilus planipennis TaxID=224129 RepID=A0A1W4X4G3_AGRPL|nr:uncharacterized protein LOC108740929 [Agrilus planipennis]
MAIPFDVSSDEKLDQLFTRLYEILQQIYHLTQQTASGQQPTITRVRCSAGASRHIQDHQIHSSYPAVLPEIVNDLALLPRPSAQYLEGEAVLQPQAMPTPRRRKRRRTSSKSCCDANKSVEAATVEDDGHQVWTQVGMPLLKMAKDFDPSEQQFTCKEKNDDEVTGAKEDSCQSESIFSKLVPDLSSKSIWTAVICVVGWHLLRTR